MSKTDSESGSRVSCAELLADWPRAVGRIPVQHVPVVDLVLPARSARRAGHSRAHVDALIESGDRFPPLLVDRATMVVIDGAHRLRAATARRSETIAVQFVDVEPNDIFALAVRANTVHGLPLTLADRKHAATELLTSHPQWSDRLVGRIAGLSHKTVGVLRRRATGEKSQSHARVGRDGRRRPTDSATGRRLAAAAIRETPAASLRQIAELAGVSVGTVRDVRARLERGIDPVPMPRGVPRPEPARGTGDRADAPGADVARLRRDPALRFSESGRAVLRLLTTSEGLVVEFGRLLGTVPPHCRPAIAELAHRQGRLWQALADRLDRQTDSPAWASGAGA